MPEFEQGLLDRIETSLDTAIISMKQVFIGQSQKGYVCHTANSKYFIKVFKSTTSFNKERWFYQQGLPSLPNLITFAEQMLVLEYIDEPSINQLELGKSERLKLLIKGLVEFHRQTFSLNEPRCFNETIDTLRFTYVLDALKSSCALTQSQQLLFTNIYNHAKNLDACRLSSVICHGDFNSNNVFFDKERFAFIDFEAASLAPASYDLMMLLSINGYLSSDIEKAISLYNEVANSVSQPPLTEDKSTIKIMFDIATLINALWYMVRSSDQNNFHHQALQHFKQI